MDMRVERQWVKSEKEKQTMKNIILNEIDVDFAPFSFNAHKNDQRFTR